MQKTTKSNKFLTIFLSVFWLSIFLILIFSIVEKKILYPVKYYDIVAENASKYNIEKSLILSIIKTESSFDKNAKSSKGAKGLMQLTDSTSAFIAKNLDITEYDNFNPDTNIKFGCYYLNYLVNKFKNTETALACYNAGEGNVTNWLSNKNFSDDKKNLKNIPFKETSDFINKINSAQKKYKTIYNNILDK